MAIKPDVGMRPAVGDSKERSRFLNAVTRVLTARAAEPWLAGIAALALTAAFSWRPSFWFDEAATISAANRSEIDLVRMLLNFDAVHGVFYMAMHGWFSLVPITEFTARLPSAIAVGVGAAGMIVLGRLVSDRRTAWAAAVSFAILPRILLSGIETRSFAFSAALAVWLTVVLVIAATRRGGALWSLYALVLALATSTFLYLALLVPAHAVTLLALRRSRRAIPGFAIAAIGGVTLASPVIVIAATQSTQIAWIGGTAQNYLAAVAVDQWFTGSRIFAGAAAVVLAAGAVALVRARPTRSATALAVALPWFLVPTALVVGYSGLVEDIYQARYLTFTAPGLALLLGVCVAAISRDRTRVTAAVLVALTLAAAPAFAAQRGPYAKPGGADYSAINDVIAARAQPGDCVAFDTSAPQTPGPLRAVVSARPNVYTGLVDVAAGAPGPLMTQLWAEDLPLDSDSVTLRLAQCSALWAVTYRAGSSPVVDAAGAQGLAFEHRWVLNNNAVVLLRRP